VPDAVLDGDGQHVVLIGRLLRTPCQDLNRAGMLGVIQRDDLRLMVAVAHGTDEQCDATDFRPRDEPERLGDIERRFANADLTDLR
jgi:hypothetical protein